LTKYADFPNFPYKNVKIVVNLLPWVVENGFWFGDFWDLRMKMAETKLVLFGV
jgi:hypothetical protein